LTSDNQENIMRVVIVGVGGVGTRIARELPMYMSRKHAGSEVVLIDGDRFEAKNMDRQDFNPKTGLGVNKAIEWAEELTPKYPELAVSAFAEYVTEDNVAQFITDGSVVFCCVDNHASRKLLSDHASTLRDTILVSGGNDYYDGNIQMHVRRDGKDATAPITHLHPEIDMPADKNPAHMSCEELAAAGSPQLQFANLKVATEMLCSFYMATEEKLGIKYSEAYFDITKGTQRPIMRKVIQNVDTETSDGDAALADGTGAVAAAVGQDQR